MKSIIISVMLLSSIVFIAGCTDPVSPISFPYKGNIYYSNGGEVFRLQLSDQVSSKLFTNARHPDIANNGKILAVEISPRTRLIFSDLTGANRETVLAGVDYTGPKSRQYMNKPRLSYDQRYVVYESDNVYNPNSYVVSASDGTLIAIIGDYDNKQPMVSPSWSPDGSIVVAGWKSMNNGIYKVSPDFSSIVRIDPSLTNVDEPSVSPDGKFIAFTRDGQVWIMGIDGSNPTQLYVGDKYFRMPTWSPDSKYIAAVQTNGTGRIHIFDIDAKSVAEVPGVHYVSPEHQLCWRY